MEEVNEQIFPELHCAIKIPPYDHGPEVTWYGAVSQVY